MGQLPAPAPCPQSDASTRKTPSSIATTELATDRAKRASTHAAAAVDINRLAGDESAVLAGKEGDGRGDFVRRSGPAERNDGRGPLDDFEETRWRTTGFEQSGQFGGLDVARHPCVGRDPGCRELARQAGDHRMHAA